MMKRPMTRPLPVADMDTKPYWDYCKQHELRVQKCLKCGKIYSPPSMICPHCMNVGSEWVKLSGKGKVYSFIIVRRQYHPMLPSPYVVAIIELEEGIHMLSNVVECQPEEVKMEMPVTVVWDDASPEISMPKFKPA
jgi:uncharacterized protein